MVQRDIGTQRKSEMLPRPKSKPKKKASKVDEKITTSLIDAMKNHVPDIGLAWVANIQAELSTISWPKSNDEGSADTFAAYAHVLIDEMGNRAPRGREVQWRNLTRLFGSLVWARFGFVDATGELIGTPPLLDEMKPENADAASSALALRRLLPIMPTIAQRYRIFRREAELLARISRPS